MPGPPKKLKKKLVLKDVESTPPPIPEPVSNPVIETVKEEELYKKEHFESNDIELKNREELTRDENEYSYLYPNYYLDTIILDVALVDLTPPTIIFNSPSLTIYQNNIRTYKNI